MLPDMERLNRAVKETLSPKRYAHSLAVRDRAIELAGMYGYDWYKAGVAGLIHDICKEMDEDAQLNYLRRCGILLDALTLMHPQVWHGITASFYVRREYGIRDEEILSAVRYHTTGRAAMTLGEKILYLADLTSADRIFPNVDHVRMLCEQSLDDAVAYCQGTIMERLVRERRPIVQDALEAYNYYVMRVFPVQETGKKEGSQV